jgi:mannose-1-phosphate guanylyltransferase
VLIDSPLRPMVNAHAISGAEATIAVFATSDTEGKGIVEMGDEGRIRSFVEKQGGDLGPRSTLVNAGIYLVDPAFVRDMTPEGAASDFGNEVFPDALRAGRRLFGYVLPQAVIDVGTPGGLRRARASVAGSRLTGPIDPGT